MRCGGMVVITNTDIIWFDIVVNVADLMHFLDDLNHLDADLINCLKGESSNVIKN